MYEYKIHYYKQISNTPALQLALKAEIEMREQGIIDDVPKVCWNHAVLCAFALNAQSIQECVGVMTFDHTEWSKSLVVVIGYIKEEYRRRGIYTALWQQLLLKASEAGVVSIYGGTQFDNEAMRALNKKLGRVETGVMMTYKLKGANSGEFLRNGTFRNPA